MLCPRCNESGTRVIDSRDLEGGGTIRRRRECEQCSYRFTTYERPEGARLTVLKRDGSRQEFDRGKLQAGLMRSRAAPTGRIRLPDWLAANADTLGRQWSSELDRHFRV